MKKLVFSAILFVLVVLVVEGAAFVGYRVTEGEWFSWSDFQSQRDDVVADYRGRLPQTQQAEGGAVRRGRAEVIHPYLGFVIESQNEVTLNLTVYIIGHSLKWQTEGSWRLEDRRDGNRTDWRARSQIQLAF